MDCPFFQLCKVSSPRAESPQLVPHVVRDFVERQGDRNELSRWGEGLSRMPNPQSAPVRSLPYVFT